MIKNIRESSDFNLDLLFQFYFVYSIENPLIGRDCIFFSTIQDFVEIKNSIIKINVTCDG